MAEGLQEAFTENERAAEPWLLYDSIVIGPGAKEQVPSWYNTWAEFAKALGKLVFFGQKRQGAPDWATNVGGEREDYSMFFYQYGIEMIPPMAGNSAQTSVLDAQFMPMEFPSILATYASVELKQASTDVVLKLPTAHAPGAVGIDARRIDSAAIPAVIPGSNGQLMISNSWHFAEERAIPRQGSWDVTMKIENPAEDFLKSIPATAGPGFKQVALPGDPIVILEFPNWYVIRMWFRGKRHTQLRGAYQK
jgi:hypothetical protein